MPGCAVYRCGRNSSKPTYRDPEKKTRITFHQFPADKEVKEKWTLKIRQHGKPAKKGEPWTPNSNSKVCAIHFLESEVLKTQSKAGREMTIIAEGAVPSIFPEIPLSKIHFEAVRAQPTLSSLPQSHNVMERGSASDKLAIYANNLDRAPGEKVVMVYEQSWNSTHEMAASDMLRRAVEGLDLEGDEQQQSLPSFQQEFMPREQPLVVDQDIVDTVADDGTLLQLFNLNGPFHLDGSEVGKKIVSLPTEEGLSVYLPGSSGVLKASTSSACAEMVSMPQPEEVAPVVHEPKAVQLPPPEEELEGSSEGTVTGAQPFLPQDSDTQDEGGAAQQGPEEPDDACCSGGAAAADSFAYGALSDNGGKSGFEERLRDVVEQLQNFAFDMYKIFPPDNVTTFYNMITALNMEGNKLLQQKAYLDGMFKRCSQLTVDSGEAKRPRDKPGSSQWVGDIPQDLADISTEDIIAPTVNWSLQDFQALVGNDEFHQLYGQQQNC